MLGAMIGDTVGSVYEFAPINSKDFEFFSAHAEFTDDTVCTAAVADVLLHDRPPAATLQEWCRRYPDYGYGGMFSEWIRQDPPRPYGSFGNGAAMRVSPVARLYRSRDLPAALAASDRVTEVTHNHEEGLKGARATVHAIWLAYRGEDPKTIRDAIGQRYRYDLERSVDEIRPGYEFNEICQDTVPEAIICALESTSFEDAIRNAVSLGGDADTLAAIAGPIAEVLHGIPPEFKTQMLEVYLQDAPDIRRVLEELY